MAKYSSFHKAYHKVYNRDARKHQKHLSIRTTKKQAQKFEKEVRLRRKFPDKKKWQNEN